MKKKYSLVTIILSVIIAMFITFEVVYILLDDRNEKNKVELAEQYKQQVLDVKKEYQDQFTALNDNIPDEYKNTELFKKLAYIDSYYRSLYVGKIDEDKLISYVANAYIAGAGDKYGAYYTAEEFDDILTESDGNICGIGVHVIYNKENNAIEILSVMPHSPALESGLKANDLIVKIDGEEVSVLGYSDSVSKVKGKEGTKVTLTVLRDGEYTEIDVTRKKFESETVVYHKFEFDNTIGVIRIYEFNESVPHQFKEAVENLLNDGVESLVFDMRYNPGGTLSSVVDVLDYLLPAGDIVYITDANGKVVQKYTSDEKCIDVPMAVLTNGSTASAAELFSCALRDYGKAVLVGEKTFGKGTMQTLIYLPDKSGLRFSTNMYNPPKSENYEGKGLIPDVEAELDEAAKDKNFYKLTDSEDNQLIAACRELGYK